MNIEFNFIERTLRLKLNHINLFYGGNNSGKSDLSNFFESGFKGVENNFFVDRCQVSKKDFEVICCGPSTSIQDELKLTSKTILAKEIKECFSSFDPVLLQETAMKLNEALSPLTKTLDDKWKKLNLFQKEYFKGNFEFIDFIKLMKYNYLFYNEDSLSKSSNRTFIYQLYCSYLSQFKNSIFIIDDFDDALDFSQCIEQLSYFENFNITFILFTKSAQLCTYCRNNYPIFLMNKNLMGYDDFIDKKIFSILKEKNESEGIPFYDAFETNVVKLELTNYHQLLLNLLSSKTPEIELNFLKNSKVISEKELDFAKKIIFL